MPTFHDCWFLTGPTAAGKTDVAIELAHRIGGEIVSMDSMALFQGMDIGTAKPTPAQRAQTPHHLLDLVDPAKEFSLAAYLAAAQHAVAEIRSRRREPVFVGGTPLYLKGLLRGVFEGPAADWDFRNALAAEAERHGPGYLHERLATVDPASAQRLHANDTKRLIRALEVYEKTGEPISSLQRQFDTGRPAENCRVFVLNWPRELLYDRIDRRVDAMFAIGLVEEVRWLLSRSEGLGKTARQAVGYKEVIDYLEGKQSLATTKELVQQHSRQLAKRQLTWFRSLSECRTVDLAEPFRPAEVAQRLLREAGPAA